MIRISLIQALTYEIFYGLYELLKLGYLASFCKTKGYKDIKIYSSLFKSNTKIIKEISTSDIVGITVIFPMIAHTFFF